MEQSIKLRGYENWAVWKFQTRVLLKSKNVFDVVSGDKKKPEIRDGRKDEDEKELRKWMLEDAKAQECIVSRMEEGPLSHLLMCQTAEEIWEKLLVVYEQKSNVSAHLLQQKFYNLKFGESVADYFSKLSDISGQLRQMGQPINDKMIVTKIIMSLPEKYKHFVSAWDSVADGDQNLNYLMSRLLIEEERINGESEENKGEAAFHAKKRNFVKNITQVKCYQCGKSGHIKKWCPENIVCHVCKKRGHMKKDCRARNKERYSKDAMFSTAACHVEVDHWYADSGASEHMCYVKSLFNSLEKLEKPRYVKIGDGSMLEVLGTGTVDVSSYTGKFWKKISLKGVLYVPKLKMNLFSIGSALDKGYTMSCDRARCWFKNKHYSVTATAERSDKLYIMNFRNKKDSRVNFTMSKDSLKDWHEKLAHQNMQHVLKVLRQNNISVSDKEKYFCDACHEGKEHKQPFKPSESLSSSTCEIIHADVCGPMEEVSIGGSKYFLLLKDDLSHYRNVYFLKEKSEVTRKMKEFIKEAENITGNTIKTVRTDNGSEFCNKELSSYFKEKGIRHERTVAYTPEQNGKIEREMRTITESARTMMLARKLSKRFWAEAVNTAVYVINRSGTSGVKDKNPYELWFNRKVDLNEFKVFGSEVYVHVPKQRRQKWDAKGRKGMFVGYQDNSKAYRIYYKNKDDVEIARDVTFIKESNRQNLIIEDISEDNDIGAEKSENEEDGETVEEKTENKKRSKKTPVWMKDYEVYMALNVMNYLDEVPKCYKEIEGREDAYQWKDAVKRELDSIKENNTWDVIKKPEGVEIIDSKWVFNYKENEKNELKYKARLVARGFAQNKCFDYSEIYAPVAKLETLRVLLNAGVQRGYTFQQLDVKTAFLNGTLKEDVYMYPPEGDQQGNDCVYKLKKSLYGLKQSAKCWNEKFDIVMKTLKFKQSENDSCLYILKVDKEAIYLLLYVDDIIITGNSLDMIEKVKYELMKEFKMTVKGDLKHFLGFEIDYDKGSGILKLNQEKYVNKILKKFNLENCKPVKIPIEPKLQIIETENKNKTNNPVRELVGCLMYLMVGSRPDICFAVNYLSRYQDKANESVWKYLKTVLRYLQGTKSYGLTYKKGENNLEAYADADWGGDVNDRKSVSGYCIFMNGNLLEWKTKKQNCIALSSAEAELVSLCSCIQEYMWMKKLLSEIEMKIESCVIYEDNQACISIVENPKKMKRVKHMDIKWKYVSEKIKNKEVKLEFIDSQNQVADVLTKGLNKMLFVNHASKFFNL